jgi:hypothetical protein
LCISERLPYLVGLNGKKSGNSMAGLRSLGVDLGIFSGHTGQSFFNGRDYSGFGDAFNSSFVEMALSAADFELEHLHVFLFFAWAPFSLDDGVLFNPDHRHYKSWNKSGDASPI